MADNKLLNVSPEEWGISLMTAFGAPNNYSGLLPSKMTIARFAADQTDRQRLYQAMAVASGLTLAEAIGASLVASSWLPLIMTVGVSAVLIWQYMDAINNPHADVMPINSPNNQNG